MQIELFNELNNVFSCHIVIQVQATTLEEFEAQLKQREADEVLRRKVALAKGESDWGLKLITILCSVKQRLAVVFEKHFLNCDSVGFVNWLQGVSGIRLF